MPEVLSPPGLRLVDHIKDIWFRKSKPLSKDLEPFLQIKALAALVHLARKNQLYHRLSINQDYCNSWEPVFIPLGIESIIVPSDDSDYPEREGYAFKLSKENSENDLHAAPNASDETEQDTSFGGSACQL